MKRCMLVMVMRRASRGLDDGLPSSPAQAGAGVEDAFQLRASLPRLAWAQAQIPAAEAQVGEAGA